MSNEIRIVFNRLPNMTKEVRKRASKVVKKTVGFVERHARDAMEGPKHGRLYKRRAITRSARGKIGKGLIAAGARARIGMRIVDPATSGARVTVGYTYHRASAPGEAPAVDLGGLRSSIQGEMTGETSGVVFTNQGYGPPLEFGGKHVRPRPFMRPAAKDGQSYLDAEMARELRGMK